MGGSRLQKFLRSRCDQKHSLAKHTDLRTTKPWAPSQATEVTLLISGLAAKTEGADQAPTPPIYPSLGLSQTAASPSSTRADSRCARSRRKWASRRRSSAARSRLASACQHRRSPTEVVKSASLGWVPTLGFPRRPHFGVTLNFCAFALRGLRRTGRPATPGQFAALCAAQKARRAAGAPGRLARPQTRDSAAAGSRPRLDRRPVRSGYGSGESRTSSAHLAQAWERISSW